MLHILQRYFLPGRASFCEEEEEGGGEEEDDDGADDAKNADGVDFVSVVAVAVAVTFSVVIVDVATAAAAGVIDVLKIDADDGADAAFTCACASFLANFAARTGQ